MEGKTREVSGKLPDGVPYINIGTGKSCCFIHLSEFLLRQLQKQPLLHYAVEEALICATSGYYAAGILAFSQLLSLFAVRTPAARHKVAHELLKSQPAEEVFNAVRTELKSAAYGKYTTELAKEGDAREYHKRLHEEWRRMFLRGSP